MTALSLCSGIVCKNPATDERIGGIDFTVALESPGYYNGQAYHSIGEVAEWLKAAAC